MQKEKKKVGLEEPEEPENKLTEDSVAYQIAISTEWVEGLMQRIQQSLISNTPLIMCEKDLDALEFMVLATSVAESKVILMAVERMKGEAEKVQSKEE